MAIPWESVQKPPMPHVEFEEHASAKAWPGHSGKGRMETTGLPNGNHD